MATKTQILDALAAEKTVQEADVAVVDKKIADAQLLTDGVNYPDAMLPVPAGPAVPPKSIEEKVTDAVKLALPSQVELDAMIAAEIEAQVKPAVEAAVKARVAAAVSVAVSTVEKPA